MLVARYLIEDNNKDMIILDLNATNSVVIVKSIFKKLIGKYEIFTKEEEDELYKSIA